MAHADKVGIAAAVNPDAFSSLSGSPKTQLNIGKSIFFNERINTTGSGLVQVLLIDGSTFTVGPGSDLVIDRFVYDPNKKTGEVVATFTKGAMRFVGGKLSKNEGGVTVNTPAGALAIRGGMFMTNGKVFAFLFGQNMTLTKNGTSLTVFAPGNLIDAINGEIRETKPSDIAVLMAALTPSGNGGVTPGQTPQPAQNGVKAATLGNISADIINEATATQIQDAINKEIANLNNAPTDPTDTTTPGEPTTTPTTTGDPTPTPPANTLALGYAAGAFTQTRYYGPSIQSSNHEYGDYDRAGLMLSFSPTDVALLFDGTTKAFSGAVFNLFASDDGGAKITFVPIKLTDLQSDDPQVTAQLQALQQSLENSGIFLGAAATDSENPNSSIVVYQHTIAGDPPQFVTDSTETVNSGTATLIGFTGNGQVFCTTCDFMKWGAWFADLNVSEHPDALNEQSEPTDHTTRIEAVGWWVAADSLPTIGQLPTLGTTSYIGSAIGQVLYDNDGIQSYLAKGDVHMDWDFQQRAGLLEISHFRDQGSEPALPELNVSGRMDMPGVAANLTNKFSGPLLGTLGDGHCAPTVSGLANGSFVANGNDKTAGAIGNFAVATSGQNPIYQASGIFGAGRNGPVDASGHLDLPTNAFNDGPRSNLLFGRSIGQ